VKKQIIKVELERAEGPIEACIKVEFSGPDAVTQAQKQLRQWGETAPEKGGYDKCDFVITFEDGETYTGRYDLVRSGLNDAGETILEQVRRFLGFIAGTYRPAWVDDKTWAQIRQRYDSGRAAEAQAFLEAYAVYPDG
jgi:hypothetical protein